MSVYLKDASHVLLNSSLVATATACCCTCHCPNVSLDISVTQVCSGVTTSLSWHDAGVIGCGGSAQFCTNRPFAGLSASVCITRPGITWVLSAQVLPFTCIPGQSMNLPDPPNGTYTLSQSIGADSITWTITVGCITGACCLCNGTCVVESPTDCTNDGGFYQGDNTTCPPTPACLACPSAENISVTTHVHSVTTGSVNNCSWDITSGNLSHTFAATDFDSSCDLTFAGPNNICVSGCSGTICGGGFPNLAGNAAATIRVIFSCAIRQVDVICNWNPIACACCTGDCNSSCTNSCTDFCSQDFSFSSDNHGTHSVNGTCTHMSGGTTFTSTVFATITF